MFINKIRPYLTRDKKLLVSTPQAIAQRAVQKVKVEYENLDAIVTIDDAIKHNSFFSLGHDNRIVKGRPVEILESEASTVDHVIEGEVRIGGQEHFYLETNAALVR